jgi:hypothetical protein
MKRPKKVYDHLPGDVPLKVQSCLILDQLNHVIKENYEHFYSEIKNKNQQSQNLSDILRLFKF